MSLISLLLTLQALVLQNQAQCVQNLVFLDDYCGHIRRTLRATMRSEIQQLAYDATEVNLTLGQRYEVTNQVTGLYDVCMSRRNSYVSNATLFNYTSWSWKLATCNIVNGVSQATINVYDTLDCSGSNILKTWTYTDGDTRNFTDIPPEQEREEEYWFWWFEDAPTFVGYGEDTYEEISVSCFSGTDDDGTDLNSCEGDYFTAYRFDWPNTRTDNYTGFEDFTRDEMFELFEQMDDRGVTGTEYDTIYKAKDVETQFRLISECSVAYSDYNFNEQWCVNNSGTVEVYQEKWNLGVQGCTGTESSNKTRFTNGGVKTKDCGFIEDSTWKDNSNYNCLVRTICPYFGNTAPADRTITTTTGSCAPTSSPTPEEDNKAFSLNVITSFVIVMAAFYQTL